MNENNVKTKKKKSKVLLIIIIIILILALIAGGIYLMSSNDKTPWKTGEVQILEQKIKLPMLITDFEKQFNVKLVKTDEEQMNTVTIDEDTDTPLNLTIFVFDDSITGLVVSTYKSNDEEQETAINEIASERSIAKRVVFPGNVTIDTPITEINKIYQSKPLNVNYKQGIETSISDKTRTDEYKGKYGYVKFFSVDNEIIEIEYVRADFR